MLLLLLLISTGCDVNIPGCGKRSLPFFKPVTLTQAPKPSVNVSIVQTPNTIPSQNSTPSSPLPSTVSVNPTSKQPVLESSIEMSITKPKPTATATATPTSTPQEVEKIAYTTMEQGKPTLWTMNTDGTDRTRLTPIGTSSWFPLWSPNGKLLAFLSDMKDGKINLYVLKKGATEAQQITFFEDMSFKDATNLKPPFSWSPLSDEIAFYYHNEIRKVWEDSYELETIATVDSEFSISAIEWAPHRDNKYVAYLVKKGVNYFGLKISNPRLKDDLKLTDSSVPLSDISWSSDARDVAYISDHTIIYSASAQTSFPKVLLSLPSSLLGSLISFSPSETGTILMVLAKQDAAESGYRVAIVDKFAKDSDPGSLKYLTEPGVDYAIWSPNGSKIAYLQSGELWVMDGLTGANKTRIAATGILSPCWSKK